MKNFKTLGLLAVLSSLSIGSWAYAAWTYSTSVGNGDSISAEKWNSIVAQLIAVSVNPDWNAVTGYARILNKPVIPEAQVNTDWNATAGVAQILNKPTIPAAQVNSDWNATSGIAQILNRPNISGLSGNVGIGTASPQSALHIFNSVQVAPSLTLGAAASAIINTAGSAGGELAIGGVGNASPWAAWLQARNWANAANPIAINPLGGNVAIGTTNPQAKLEIEVPGTLQQADGLIVDYPSGYPANSAISVSMPGYSGSARNLIQASSGASNSSFVVKSDGNVGIGTTSPGNKFTIDGSAPIAEIRSGGYLMLRPTANDWDFRLQALAGNKFGIFSGGDLVNPVMALINGGNVGIGTTNPQSKLDVTGTVKATKLNVSGGSHFKMNLNHCGGGCAGNHALSTWVSLSGYTWSQVYNTDPANFVKSGGTVTINETGVYMIRLQAMAMPSAATSYMGAAYYCPFVNGGANCLGDVGLEHRYGPAGYWSQGRREYVAQFSAGTTFAYGINTVQAMSYWGHDSYTSLEIIRIN